MHADKNLPPLLGALVIALIPHTLQLPLWVVVWCIVFWGYMLLTTIYRLPRPGKVFRLLITMGGLLAVLLSSGIHLSRNAGVALLWIMASIKPMEIRSYRDEMVTVFLIYFLAVACLFFSSSLSVGLYMVFSICVTTAVVIHLHHPGGRWTDKLKLSTTLMLKALPLALILFIAFPRMQGSLWGYRSPAEALTGFSDRLAPGSVARLVRNDEIAFRVEFNGPMPAPDRLYWRGLVFWHFDGRAWHRGGIPFYVGGPIHGQQTTAYTITLEPHNDRWLFALDLPFESGANAFILSDHTLASRWTVRQRIRYRAKSYILYNTGPIWRWEQAAQQMPPDTNPAAVDLAREWRAASQVPAQIVSAALEFLQKNGFTYTLNPPPLGEEPVDDFLFKTRKGYCEHYASAFAFLMRAAGIPARLVAGYLGGELNPYGGYLIVRQSDAHVWVEVWLAGQGWVRVDPTSSVVPERIAGGMAAALPPEERSAYGAYIGSGPFFRTRLQVRLGWDALNNQWNNWVLGYSDQRQKALLARIGIRPDTRAGWLAAFVMGAGLAGLVALLYFFRSFQKSDRKGDDVRDTYLAFGAKLARIGLPREPHQGPRGYAETVLAARRDLKTRVLDIVDLYVRLRYGRGGNRNDLKRLKALVKQFRP